MITMKKYITITKNMRRRSKTRIVSVLRGKGEWKSLALGRLHKLLSKLLLKFLNQRPIHLKISGTGHSIHEQPKKAGGGGKGSWGSVKDEIKEALNE